jgi:hypothetical protein
MRVVCLAFLLLLVTACDSASKNECVEYVPFCYMGSSPGSGIREEIVVKVCYPLEVNLGGTATVQVDVSNGSYFNFDKLSLGFEPVQGIDFYGMAFRLEGVEPTHTSTTERNNWTSIKWGTLPLPADGKASVAVRFKAVKSGPTGAVLGFSASTNNVWPVCEVRQEIFTTVD